MDIGRVEELLGSEFSQRDDNFLSYSVPREDIMARMRNRARAYYVVIAPRGSGKSGLLLMLQEELKRTSAASSIVIKKYYEDVTFPDGAPSVDASVRYWISTLLQWVVAQIGLQFEVPKTADEIYAVELAEKLGVRERKLGQTPSGPGQQGYDHLRYVAQRLLEKNQKTYWLLLDEMDDLYSNTPERNSALVGLLQACDAVTKLSKKIVVRITIRPHIHTILKTQFDVVQKFRDAELPLHWDEIQLRNILVRRIEYFEGAHGRGHPEFELSSPSNDRNQANRNACQVIRRFFADFDSGFKAESSSDYRALQTLSLRRPRWMIEYCWLALLDSKTDFATAASFNRAMQVFGQNRIDFLAAEHHPHLPDFLAWLNRLAAARRQRFGTSEEFRDLLVQHVVRTDGTSVGERPVSQAEDAQALKIAQALFMLEVVRAHQFVGGRDDHRFYTYADSPELIASWGGRANMTWELHETFARALNIIDNGTYRVGGQTRLFGDRRAGGTRGRTNRPGSKSRRKAKEAALLANGASGLEAADTAINAEAALDAEHR